MLLTDSTREIIVVSSIAVGLPGAITAIVAVARRFLGREIPSARVVNVTRTSLRIMRSLALVGLVTGVCAGYWAMSHSISVLVARDAVPGYGWVFEQRLARSVDEYPRADGAAPMPRYVPPCWLVNTASAPLRRLEIEYMPERVGRDDVEVEYVINEEITIPPGSRIAGCAYAFLGPGAPPKIARKSKEPLMRSNTWLTWD